MQAGQRLTDADAEFFRSLGRGTCRACGFIRPARADRCSRCPPGVPAGLARLVLAGDVIEPTLAAHVRFMEQQDAAPSVTTAENIVADSFHAASSAQDSQGPAAPQQEVGREHRRLRWRPVDNA